MNILISINEAYELPCKIMLASLKKNTNEEINVYLIYSDFNNKKLNEFKKYLLTKMGINIFTYSINNLNIKDYLPIYSYFGIECYFRIFAQEILPKNIDRILWLDSDILINGNIKGLYYMNFNGKYLIACENMNDNKLSNKRLNLPESNIYFNSGVLLMNLEKIRTFDVLYKSKIILKEYKDKIIFPDQDILNILYFNKIKYAKPEVYNYQIRGQKDVDSEYIKAFIIHYVTSYKPWKIKFNNNSNRLYYKYFKKINRCKYFYICICNRIYRIIYFFNKIIKEKH